MIEIAGKLGFTGFFEMKLDSKDRVTTPAAFTKVLQTVYASEGGLLVATVSMDNCIEILPISVYMEKVEEIEGLSNFDENARRIRRLTNAYSFQVSLDSANRIRIPAQLIEERGIGKEVTVVGQRTHFEIWDRPAWTDYQSRLKDLDEAAQNIQQTQKA